MNKTREKFLLYRIQERKDQKSFSEVYKYLLEPIYRFVFFKVNDEQTAQDITAEVFLKCWKKLTGERGKTVKHLRAFFYTVARNQIIDYYRSGAHQKQVYISDNLQRDLIDHKDGKQQIEVKIESEYILKLVQLLKESYKEIIILRYVEEMNLVEISKIIEKTPVATRVLLHRANQALQREYEKATKSN